MCQEILDSFNCQKISLPIKRPLQLSFINSQLSNFSFNCHTFPIPTKVSFNDNMFLQLPCLFIISISKNFLGCQNNSWLISFSVLKIFDLNCLKVRFSEGQKVTIIVKKLRQPLNVSFAYPTVKNPNTCQYQNIRYQNVTTSIKSFFCPSKHYTACQYQEICPTIKISFLSRDYWLLQLSKDFITYQKNLFSCLSSTVNCQNIPLTVTSFLYLPNFPSTVTYFFNCHVFLLYTYQRIPLAVKTFFDL